DRARARRVRSHPPLALRHGAGRHRRGQLARELVEAGDRLLFAVRGEELLVSREAVGPEDPAQEKNRLEGPSAVAGGSALRKVYEEAVRPEAQDVVDPDHDVGGNGVEGTEPRQELLRTVRGLESERSVVEELYRGMERAGDAIDVEGVEQRLDGTRRRRGPGARGTVGEEIGMPRIQLGDRITQAVRMEDLGPTASPGRIGLDPADPLVLVSPDVEASVPDTARG